VKAQEAGQELGQGRLADARQVFDQQVAARQQAGEGQAQLPLLAEDHLFCPLEDGSEGGRDLGRALGAGG